MALLAPMSSLTAVDARTRTLINQKQEWHLCPAISKERTTPSWNKQYTPEFQITMDPEATSRESALQMSTHCNTRFQE
jgi:hypothetical protein